MKRFFIVSVFMLGGLVAYSQDNVIKANLLSPIVKTGNFQYERMLSEKTSLQLGVFFSAFSPFGDDATQFKGFGITPEFRFYPSETGPDGFFIAPYIRYRSFNLSSELGDEANLTLFSGGVIVGRQWMFNDIVTFETFLGPQYSVGDAEVVAGTGDSLSTDFFDGFGIRAGITLGVAF